MTKQGQTSASRILLIAAVLLVFQVPGATAQDSDDGICVLGTEICLPPLFDGGCGYQEDSHQGLFEYHIAGVRDPVVAGTYYWAAAMGETWGTRDGGSCHVNVMCTITVIDGGVVEYYDLYQDGARNKWLSGEWKGVPFTFSFDGEGSAWCDSNFGFEGFIGGLVGISGDHVKPGTPFDMLGPITPP